MIIDYDGNIYNEVTIGTQTWMVENLKTTHYNDGEDIGEGICYWWYNDDPNTKDPYGVLYNWFAAVDSKKLAPTGWHIPTENDWDTLINYVGDNSGHKLKLTGDTIWETHHYSGVTSSANIFGTTTNNPTGTITYSVPIGMTNYIWSSFGGKITGNPPTIISGGGINDNYIEVMLYLPHPSTIEVKYLVDNNKKIVIINPIFSVTGSTIENIGGSTTYFIPTGMTNYIWQITGGTINSGGCENDNFIEVTWDGNDNVVGVFYLDSVWKKTRWFISKKNEFTSWSQVTLENSESTNESGFSAISNGYRRFCGNILHHGENGFYWGTTEKGLRNTYYINMVPNEYGMPNNIRKILTKWYNSPSHYQTYAFSVRCIKD